MPTSGANFRERATPEVLLPRIRILGSPYARSWIRSRNTSSRGPWVGPIHGRGGRYYLRLDAYGLLWILPPGRYPPSFILTLRLASTSAASAAACAFSNRCRRAAYSGPASQWWASPFSAASSLTTPERSRTVFLVTSFGSCGPTYGPPNMRRHLDRGSEDFRGLSSPAEGVSLRIGSVSLSRSAAPRTGVRSGKLGRELRSFSRALRRSAESTVVRSRVRCICSRSCSICRSRLSMYRSRSSRSRKRAKLSPEHSSPPGPRLWPLYALLSLSRSGPGLCPLQHLFSHVD
jgi:hypothetical protein